MKDTFEFTLNNPLTEEQWDMITDVDFDRTDHVTFHTKHGKEVEFAKVIRCKDCARNPKDGHARIICPCPMDRYMGDEGFCSKAEPKEK